MMPAMDKFGRPASLLLIIAMLANGLDVGVARITYGVALPAITRDLHLSLTVAGLLGTLHLVGYLAGTLLSPAINAKIGALTLVRASHAVFAGAMLIGGLATGATTMAISRFVAGLGAGFGVFAILLIVFNATAPARRSTIGSLVWAGTGIAIVASGLAAAPLLEGAGTWRLSFFVPAGLALVVALFMPRSKAAVASPPPRDKAATSLWPTLVSSRWLPLLAAYFLFAAAYISYSTFAGVRLRELHVSSAGVTWFWVTFGVASIAGSVIGAVLLAWPRTRRLAVSAALASGMCGSLLAVQGGGTSVFAASALVGLGLIAMPAIATVLIRQRSADATYPFFFTVGTSALGIGQLLGPVAAGYVADTFGAAAVALFSASLYGLGALAGLADGLFSPRER
jgi:predicted MFS family arabinose efflux permease